MRFCRVCLAVITGVPNTSKLHLVTIADNPFYIALSTDDELAAHRELHLKQMHNRNWILFGQHADPLNRPYARETH
jgi:hypothetical protein